MKIENAKSRKNYEPNAPNKKILTCLTQARCTVFLFYVHKTAEPIHSHAHQIGFFRAQRSDAFSLIKFPHSERTERDSIENLCCFFFTVLFPIGIGQQCSKQRALAIPALWEARSSHTSNATNPFFLIIMKRQTTWASCFVARLFSVLFPPSPPSLLYSNGEHFLYFFFC